MTIPYTDQQLFDMILSAEDKLDSEGKDINRRQLEVPAIVMNQIGFVSYVSMGPSEPEVLQRIRNIHKSLYRTKDLAIGGLHGGIFMFRGIVGSISIPIIFGKVQIEPLKMTDLSENQIRWLCSRKSDLDAFIETFADLFDFTASVHPMGNYQPVRKECRNLLTLASFQLQAASATLRSAYDTRGAIQSALIGTELALKAPLKGDGASDEKLRKIGHNLRNAAEAVATSYPSFELPKVIRKIDEMPNYVENRYSSEQPDRLTTGRIVMAAQFIAGEVARCTTGGSFKSNLQLSY